MMTTMMVRILSHYAISYNNKTTHTAAESIVIDILKTMIGMMITVLSMIL